MSGPALILRGQRALPERHTSRVPKEASTQKRHSANKFEIAVDFYKIASCRITIFAFSMHVTSISNDYTSKILISNL